MIHLYEVTGVVKFIDPEIRMVIAGAEGGPLVFDGDRVSVLGEEKFWRWIVMMVAQQCECT